MRTQIGEVWVDSGQVMIVDPCYLKDWVDNDFKEKEDGDTSFSYAGACNVTLSGARAGQLEHGAVVSSTAYGDGVYPAYVERDSSGTILRLIVEFDQGNDEGHNDGDEQENDEDEN